MHGAGEKRFLKYSIQSNCQESLRKSLYSGVFLFYYSCTIVLGIYFIQLSYEIKKKKKLSQKLSLGTQPGLLTPILLKASNKWMIEVLVRYYIRKYHTHPRRMLNLFSHEGLHSACFRPSSPRLDSSPKLSSEPPICWKFTLCLHLNSMLEKVFSSKSHNRHFLLLLILFFIFYSTIEF